MRIVRRCALFICLLGASPWLSATTVAQLSFDEVIASAELVFEGRVLAVEARETGPRSIHTFVEFEILDVLKGEYAGASIELSYLGAGSVPVSLKSARCNCLSRAKPVFILWSHCRSSSCTRWWAGRRDII